MFKFESLTVPKSNQVDLLQMDSSQSKLKNDLDKSTSSSTSSKHHDYHNKSNDDEHNLTSESLGEDGFNQQRVGSAEYSENSSSDESNELSSSDENESRSEDEEQPTLSHSFRQINNRGSASINRSFKPKNKEDLFLNSLEVDRFAPKKLFGKFFIFKNN